MTAVVDLTDEAIQVAIEVVVTKTTSLTDRELDWLQDLLNERTRRRRIAERRGMVSATVTLDDEATRA